ncbi:MAG TPA: prepilin-type cleavage/methylation domain-containing protein [Cyanobacteria bacterium UBA11049]|nr:prepilin-type cleavage/methylation domain-containing protein [Cyanobacteria bacterium UBA11049]
MKIYFKIAQVISKLFKVKKRTAGFTVVELLIAILISTIVITIAGFALVTIASISQKAEAKIERRIDLSRAFDFMTHEIRMARRINRTDTTVANGTTITLENVVTNSGLNVSNLGSYGTLVLYLEIPITGNIPASCPSGSPSPTNYDIVVYDIRPKTGSWLGPSTINRYGRIPKRDGTIDPCSDSVASDVLVDSISDTDVSLSCNSPGVLSGSGGFHACVNERQVELYLRSKVTNIETHNLTSKAFSRLGSPTTELAPVLSGMRSGNEINLSWTWAGTGSPTFKLYRSVDGIATEIYSGSNLSATDTLIGNNDANCYTVTATISSYTSPASNTVCETK